jgi:hypothetical protein
MEENIAQFRQCSTYLQNRHADGYSNISTVLLERALLLEELGYPALAIYDAYNAQKILSEQFRLNASNLDPMILQGCWLVMARCCAACKLRSMADAVKDFVRPLQKLTSSPTIQEILDLCEIESEVPEPGQCYFAISGFPWDSIAQPKNLHSTAVLDRIQARLNAKFGNLLSIQVIPGRGRGLIANRNIPKGQLIFVEKSISISNSRTRNTRAECGHCCSFVLLPLPFVCPVARCEEVFCCEECMNNAMQWYHPVLCGKPPLKPNGPVLSTMLQAQSIASLWYKFTVKLIATAVHLQCDILEVPVISHLSVPISTGNSDNRLIITWDRIMQCYEELLGWFGLEQFNALVGIWLCVFGF